MAARNGVSSADIARITGVSRATVSYIINNRTDQTIRAETRKRVLDAIEQHGYRPNSSARALASGKTNTIALWAPALNRSVSGHIIEQIMKEARRDGYHVIVVETKSETPDSLSRAGRLDAGTVDGILAVDSMPRIDELITRFSNIPPIVGLGAAFSTQADHSGVDLRAGSRLAAGHLLEQGCRKIAFASHSSHHFPGDPRYDAYIEAIANAGCPPDVISLPQPFSRDAYLAVRDRFSKGDLPDAIFCFNDACALGANKALHDLGLRVPDDVALIGSDGITETEFSVPSLSTVAMPFEQMCATAWSYLMRRIAEPDCPLMGTVFPMELIVRESSRRKNSVLKETKL